LASFRAAAKAASRDLSRSSWMVTRVSLGSTKPVQTEAISPLSFCDVVTVALRIPAPFVAERTRIRVDDQFARGIVDEVKRLLASGVPGSARPFGGLVYRQVMELLAGVRDEAATRALIAQENRRYARTASYAQVTEPLYDRSLDRYRHYRAHLEPVIPILRPTIERLGYTVD